MIRHSIKDAVVKKGALVLIASGVHFCSCPAAYARSEFCLNDGWSGVAWSESGVTNAVQNITLPHNWDDYHGYRHLFHGNLHGRAIYSRTFVNESEQGTRQFLVFEGAGSYLTVRLNDREICTRRPAGRLVVTVEATGAIREGKNDLVVICDHPSDISDMPWVCGGCLKCTCESPEPFGLFRSVRLVSTASVRIAPFGTHVWSNAGCDAVYVETEIDAGTADISRLSVRARCDELNVESSVSCKTSKDGIVRIVMPRQHLERWSPENPKLYLFHVEVLNHEGAVLDADDVKTGFRTVKWPRPGDSDHRFFLNGTPVFIHGAAETDHRLGGGLAFEKEEIDARCREFKKLGLNGFREGHEPHDLRFARNADELGLLYWAGFSTQSYVDTDAFRSNFTEAVVQWVKERRNSPSLVIWGLQNESLLPVDYAKELTEIIKRLDPLTGENGRVVVTCNWGGGTDWNVVQNWSGTYAGYGGTLMTYELDLAKEDQLLNGEYGAWRLVGYHSDPDAPWDINGAWTEEHQARVFYEKLLRAWKAKNHVCGQFQWTFFSHENPGRGPRVDEGYRLIDKLGPINHKGIYSIWGRRTESWYLYYAYGKHLRDKTLDIHLKRPLSWWLSEGHRLAEPKTADACALDPIEGATYVLRLNCGGDKAVDSFGNVWAADDTRYVRSWAMDGDLRIKGGELNPVLGSQDVVDGRVMNATDQDQAILKSFRYGRGRLRFVLPAPTNACCNVEMFLVEPGSYGRCFDVAINGVVVEKGLNLSDMIPERNALRRVWKVHTGTNGSVVVTFPRVSCNQAVVSAIALSTDVDSASRMQKEARAPGYPESAGYSWKELTAMVRHNTPKEDLPEKGTVCSKAKASQAAPIADKNGMHRAWVDSYVAGEYSITFRVQKGDPRGKMIRWRLEDEHCKGIIAEGSFCIREVTSDGMVVLPLKTFINAGVYTFSYAIDDDCLSVREMR